VALARIVVISTINEKVTECRELFLRRRHRFPVIGRPPVVLLASKMKLIQDACSAMKTVRERREELDMMSKNRFRMRWMWGFIRVFIIDRI
jgi:hypothetical protein